MRLALLLWLSCLPSQPATDEPLKVSGEFVLTVTELPVTVHAPKVEGLAFISWHYPRGTTVEIRNDNRELLIRALPAGDTMVWGDFGTVIDGQPQAQFTRRVILRNGLMPRPPPEVEKPETPTDGPKSTVIVTQGVAPNPQAESAAAELRDDGESVFFARAGAEDFDGNTPAYLMAAMERAQEVGYPSLIVLKGTAIVYAEKLPSTKQAIVDAVKGVK